MMEGNKTEVVQFSELQDEFMRRITAMVWCNVATVNAQGRPRSRILHPVWEGSTRWIATRPASHKSKHLTQNPYISLAYIADVSKPVYVDCRAEWVEDLAEKQRIWNLILATPEPLGYDPAPFFKSVADASFGVLKLTPWRIEVNFQGGQHLVGHQEQ